MVIACGFHTANAKNYWWQWLGCNVASVTFCACWWDVTTCYILANEMEIFGRPFLLETREEFATEFKVQQFAQRVGPGK